MLFIGFVALFASVYYAVMSLTEGMGRKRAEYSAISALLLHIRAGLSSGGGRLCDILRTFKSKPLEENGLLAVLAADVVKNENGEIGKASGGFFRDNLYRIRFLIDETDAKKLLSYLEGYGKSYIEEEKKKLSEITCYFSEREKSFSEKSEKDTKAIWTVFVFLFVGAFILLI